MRSFQIDHEGTALHHHRARAHLVERAQHAAVAPQRAVGEADDALWYRDLIRRGDDVAAIRDDLIFGRAFCDGAIREAA